MEKEFSLNENCYDRDAPEKVKFLGLKSKRFSYPEIGDRTQEEIKRAKLKHRSELSLKDWDKCKYYKSNWCEKILKNPPKGQQEISYENYNELTIEDFREKYEKSNKPVIIRGCTQNWPASTEWSLNVNLNF